MQPARDTRRLFQALPQSTALLLQWKLLFLEFTLETIRVTGIGMKTVPPHLYLRYGAVNHAEIL